MQRAPRAGRAARPSGTEQQRTSRAARACGIMGRKRGFSPDPALAGGATVPIATRHAPLAATRRAPLPTSPPSLRPSDQGRTEPPGAATPHPAPLRAGACALPFLRLLGAPVRGRAPARVEARESARQGAAAPRVRIPERPPHAARPLCRTCHPSPRRRRLRRAGGRPRRGWARAGG